MSDGIMRVVLEGGSDLKPKIVNFWITVLEAGPCFDQCVLNKFHKVCQPHDAASFYNTAS